MPSVREYQFIVGAETDTLPAAGTPTDPSDTLTLGYADDHYVQGGEPVADITALQAVAAADRADGDVLLVKSTNTLYRFDSSSAASADGVRIVQPGSGTGRWFRIRPGETATNGNYAVAGDISIGGNAAITGNVTVTGNATINGTLTAINSTTLEVVDANITLNKGGTQSSADLQDSGFTVEMSDATHARIGFNSTMASKFMAGTVGSETEIITSGLTQTMVGPKTFEEAITLKVVATPSTPASGFQRIYPKADGNIYRLPSDGIERLLVGGAGGNESVLLVNNANYTILDSDGYTTILVSTGSTNRTITLPTLADNINRLIKFKKIDSGSGFLIIDGEGSETIEGGLTLTLQSQYETAQIQAYSSEWVVIATPEKSLNMKDTIATANGRKVYRHGTNYNGGLSPTITLQLGGGTLNSVDYSAFIPYQMQDGGWRLRFSVRVTLSSQARTAARIEVAGITTGNFEQSHSGSATATAATIYFAATSPNTGRFEIGHTAATTTVYFYSGDIELAAKPTWAY